MDLNDKTPEDGPEQDWPVRQVLITLLVVLFFLVLGKAYYLILATTTYTRLQVFGLGTLVSSELIGLVALIAKLASKKETEE